MSAILLWIGLCTFHSSGAVDFPLEQGEDAAIARLERDWACITEFDTIDNVKHVKRLGITSFSDDTQFTDAGVPSVLKLAKLKELEILSGKLSDSAIAQLSALKNLERLKLLSSRISGTGFTKSNRNVSLQELKSYFKTMDFVILAVSSFLHGGSHGRTAFA
jgi:hypothetical protein